LEENPDLIAKKDDNPTKFKHNVLFNSGTQIDVATYLIAKEPSDHLKH
jgi:hypothetical protein